MREETDRIIERLRREKWTPERRQKQRDADAKWSAANPGKRQAALKAYYERNKERIRERKMASYYANREVILARQKACRAKRKVVA